MSAAEILQKIDELPEQERRWLIQQLRATEETLKVEDTAWTKFASGELLRQYVPEDATSDAD